MNQWKQSNYANYVVSNHGEVRNTKTGKVLTQSYSNSNDYYKVTLSVNGSTLPIETHRLVAETFLTKIEGYVVDHIDGDKSNNHVDNLQYITHADNLRKAKPRIIQERLSDEERDEVKRLYSTGEYSMITLTQYCNELFNRKTARQTYTRIARS